jgi:hypothetical protein
MKFLAKPALVNEERRVPQNVVAMLLGVELRRITPLSRTFPLS